MTRPVKRQTQNELQAFRLILEESNGIFMKMEGVSDFKPGFFSSYSIEILRMVFLTCDLFIAKTFENIFEVTNSDPKYYENHPTIALITKVASILRSGNRLLQDAPYHLVNEIGESGLIPKKELRTATVERLVNRAFIHISPAGDAMDFYNICHEWNRKIQQDIEKLMGPDSEM